jgi:hypothetical protein
VTLADLRDRMARGLDLMRIPLFLTIPVLLSSQLCENCLCDTSTLNVKLTDVYKFDSFHRETCKVLSNGLCLTNLVYEQ